jgi:predicted  nucleic acid-binding Zn-ribbon protein
MYFEKHSIGNYSFTFVSILLSGCNSIGPTDREAAAPEQTQMTEQLTEAQEDNAQEEKDEHDSSALTGVFVGFADTNSVEIIVGKDARMFSADEQIKSDIETLAINTNDNIRFEIKEMSQGNPLIISIGKVD